MAIAKIKLVLFDIDGTLLISGGAGENALRHACRERFGVNEDLSTIEIAGRTDSGIACRILEKHQVEVSPENIKTFLESYLYHLEVELPKTKGFLLPGVVEVLEALKAHPEVSMGLLTGNLRRGAELKLTFYGILHFFEFGAYADDHQDRNELGKFACNRALEKHGIEFSADQIYVIGDTPHDIHCGKAFGAKTAAIATGNFTCDQLAAHAPDHLFENLSDVRKVLSILDL